MVLSGRKRPDFGRFPSICPTSITSCATWSYPRPRHLFLRTPPSVSPNRRTLSHKHYIHAYGILQNPWGRNDFPMFQAKAAEVPEGSAAEARLTHSCLASKVGARRLLGAAPLIKAVIGRDLFRGNAKTRNPSSIARI